MRRLTATAAIAAVTILCSAAAEYAPGWVVAEMRAGFIPARVGGVLTDYAAVPVALTPLTSALLHAGMLHLASNLLILVFTGGACEKALGPARLLLLYLIGAYAAALGQWIGDPMARIPMIGASGAASALVGAYCVLYGRVRARAIGPLSAWTVNLLWLAAAWIAINLLAAYALLHDRIAIAAPAHIGGFLAGLLLGRPLLRSRRRSVQISERGS